MRCQCCNCNLSDQESVLKSQTTGAYLDMCKKCLKVSGITPASTTNKQSDIPYEDNVILDLNLFDNINILLDLE